MPKVINEGEVFRAVIRVLVTRGYEQATTQKLAEAAQIHEATLFRKYGSKVGLIERAIEHQLSSVPLGKVSYTGDLIADLTAILEAYLATYAEYGEIVPMVLLEIPRYPELRNVLRTPLANIQGIARIFEQYQKAGRLKEEPPFISVNAFLAPVLLHKMIVRAVPVVPVPPIDLQEYINAFLDGRKRSS